MAGGVRKLAMILLLVAIYQVSQRRVMTDSARAVEAVLHGQRLAMVRQVLDADVQPLEAIGRAEIFAGIARETQTISESLTVLLVGRQSAVLVVCVLLYIGTLSMPALLLTAVFVAAMLGVQVMGARRVRADLDAATAAENGLLDDVRDLLDGFKETKMNRARSAGLLADLGARTAAAAAGMSRMRRRNAEQFVFGQAGLLLLLGATVFCVPLIAPSYSGVVLRVTTAILFVIGSVGLLVQSAPVVAQAEAAAAAIGAVRRRLDALVAPVPLGASDALPDDFETLVLEGAGFRYPDVAGEAGFGVGPLDLVVRRGEVVFLTGGNGAGKSTVLRLLTGLYHPSAGRIRLDGAVVSAANLQAYRDKIGAVFGDYHLFRRLHALPRGGVAEVEAGLAEMGLAGKVSFAGCGEGGAFTTLDLSAGQRRRLALLVALLQDRPILVLDEVAADFDPAFRRHFYEEVLPGLRRAGKTVIAASHDDRYFDVADRVLWLEDGRILVQAGAYA